MTPDPKYLLGGSNRMAVSLCESLVSKPQAGIYTVRGGVGVGKTSLVRAALRSMGGHYETSEELVNKYIGHARFGRLDEFRGWFRSMRLLALDDIQTLEGKNKTQEEVRFGLDHMLEQGATVLVVTPVDVSSLNLNPELKSRLSAGVATTVHRPDLDLRHRILDHYMGDQRRHLRGDFKNYLLSVLTGDIREIMGFCNRARLLLGAGETLSLCNFSTHFRHLFSRAVVDFTYTTAFEEVGAHYGVSREEILSGSRRHGVTAARKTLMAILRGVYSLSNADIGSRLNVHPSSVAYGIQVVKKDEDKTATKNRLEDRIRSRHDKKITERSHE